MAEGKDTLQFVDEATAKNSPLAQWTATYSSNLVRLTNQVGQTLTYYASGFPVDCVHAAATWIFLWFAAEPMLEKLDRIKVKYGMMEDENGL